MSKIEATNQSTWRSKIKAMGPGILMASAAVGGSHIVSSTQAGASYGWALLGLVILANVFCLLYTSQQMNTTKTTIAIKYPKKYEDAQEIVELLIENECVLIDFQYMLEAQARRCLDFIDGASKVLTGNLQKVGSSMYLLTPINVVVDIEEISLSHGNQESTFDFDMKRR